LQSDELHELGQESEPEEETMSTESAASNRVMHTLHACAKACIDGELGYLAAARDARDPELKGVFEKYSKERARFVSALEHFIVSLGGSSEERGSVGGDVRRGFMAARVSTEGPTDAVILGECERGELAAIATYDHELETTPLDSLPLDVRATVVEQRAAFRAAYDDITKRDLAH
jgi:uncharacterized protein (TIGR02284 family)